MVCEMCGASTRTKSMIIEGATLLVCQSCERFAVAEAVKTTKGQVISTPVAERLAKRERRQSPRDIYEQAENFVLVPDYGVKVRAKRRKMGMSQGDLAKKINEKKSVIVKIENQDMHPSDKLVKVLEKTLAISLKESVEPATSAKESTSEAYSRSMTLGDFIKYEDQ